MSTVPPEHLLAESSRLPLLRRAASVLLTAATLGGHLLLSSTRYAVQYPAAVFHVLVAYSAMTGGVRAGLTSSGFILVYSMFFFSRPGEPSEH